MSAPTELRPTAGVFTNPLRMLGKYGQSVWLDYIRRNLITSGDLARLIQEDGLGGVTSNPAIFEKAITGSTDYTESLLELQKQKDLDATSIYERLAIRDIRDAADVLRPVYEATKSRDGYVSLEVSPFLARDTEGTIEEARRLWKAVARDNLMVKVPATNEGIPAIEQLISEGINVNVTLLFAQETYERVALAYIAGLKKRAASGGTIDRIASVASFFISRIDSMVDSIIKNRLKTTAATSEAGLLRSLLGRVAIANAKLTYQLYKEILRSEDWRALSARGAQTQRLLWASTSTKDPSYPDVLYVEELIGPETVNTIPPSTFEAFRDHGKPRPSLESDLEDAADTMETLAAVGISMREVTDDLVTQAVRLFAEPFDKLLNAVDAKCKFAVGLESAMQSYTVPSTVKAGIEAAVEDWKMAGKVRRLWARDSALWTRSDESTWLGWLSITEDQLENREHFDAVAREVRETGFTHAVLLGMGGSSLCPEVLRLSFGSTPGYPEFSVLDSTDPQQIRAVEAKVDLANTLFIVSSKSGSTLEPNIFKQYFFNRVQEVLGASQAGERFFAITDPGSKMEKIAEGDGFRRIFHGVSSIGGRFSALSDFGMVPAAVMGIDAAKFLDRADVMAVSCSSCLPLEKNPGATLGIVLGVLAKEGRDKVTLVTSPRIESLGAWLEQLLAESTGKQGKGLIPVDREPLGKPEVYGDDRVFVYTRLEGEADPAQDAAIDALAASGQPVIRIAVPDLYNLGQEFFRWEIATAVAGSVLGIHPFNQPDVEASKIATKRITTEYERTGALPPETAFAESAGLKLFADSQNASALLAAAGGDTTLSGIVRAHLARATTDDYFALLAYIEMNEANDQALQAIRTIVRDRLKVATCVGFGPRFLHSTGQAYKGGPNSGVFLQITCDDANDLAVPGQKYTFGAVKAAQARGDFEVLAERNRRALRMHMADVSKGLAELAHIVNRGLE